MRFILTYFDDFVGKDLGFLVFLKLFFYFTLAAVPIALPLSILLASLMTYGNLGEYFELTAIKSVGISVQRALIPTGIIAILVSCFSYWFNNNTLPWANLKAWSLMWDVKTTKTTLNIKEGIFYYDIPGQAIKVSKKFADNKTLKNLIIYNHTEQDGNKRITLADSGQMYTILNNKYLVFELFNGCDYAEVADKNEATVNYGKYVRNGFGHSKLVYDLSSFGMNNTQEDQFSHHAIMATLNELDKKSDSLKKEINQLVKNAFKSTSTNFTFHLRSRVDTAKAKVLPGTWIQKNILVAQKKALQNASIKEYAMNSAKSVQTASESNGNFIKSRSEEKWKADLEWHHKFTQAIACLVMFMIGAPLGSIIKKGGLGIPVLIAVIFFILSYILTINGDKWAKEGIIQVVYGAWLSNFVLFLIGVYFLIKARNDSRVFDADAYKVWYSKVLSRYNLHGKVQKKDS
jgi:lipopolysaccharide export system permease protein